MKDEQQKKLANAITRRLNTIDPDHATQNAEAGTRLAGAVSALCYETPYYEEASADQLSRAFAAISDSFPLVSEALEFGPEPKTVEALSGS